MKRLQRFSILISLAVGLTLQAQADKAPVFLYAGQSNADGREYTSNLPDYMTDGGALPSSPYTHLQWASICGNPTATAFGTRTFNSGERYAFCDVTNYWIDQAMSQSFYAIKCAYGGTAIAPGVTAAKLPVWYADATWMQTHYAYTGEDITQEAYANNNSLTKNLTEGFASLADNVLAALDGGYDVKAILWHQGESDRNAASDYYTNFKTLIAYMRQAIYVKTGDEQDLTLPFIFGTVCRNSSQYSAGVETAQRQVADEDVNVYLIDMSNASLLSDNLHFDRQATEYLGKKMYNQLVALGLVSGTTVDVEEYPVSVSPMEEATHYNSKTWDLQTLSDDTKTKLAAEVEAGTMYNTHDTYGTRRSANIYEEQLLYSDGTAVSETEGLYFTANYNRVALKDGAGLYIIDSGPIIYLPKLKAGQVVTFTAVNTKNGYTSQVVPADGMEDYVELLSASATVGNSDGTVTYRVRYNFAGEKHIGFNCKVGGGQTVVHSIALSTPESSSLLIGPDQKELYSSSKALDFSPFSGLFKAYVVTGYDDAAGTVDCEQVLQVPANTGVLLMGEECQVQVPVMYDGSTPAAPEKNLLTAVVGTGSAPANSFVLTTSGGATLFTKTMAATAMENQAYATLGSAASYGFNTMAAKTEYVYDMPTVLDGINALTFTDEVHHTVTDGSNTIGLYGPANCTAMDGRFAFDNSGLWIKESSGQLGQTYKNTRYASVVELQNGDRVKFETTDNATLTTLNAVLRGVSTATTLTSGTTYVVEADGDETVNFDFKLTGSGNRNGITRITVWSSAETTPIYACAQPTATVTLAEVRTGLYRPVVTLGCETDGATYYYKGGDAEEWTQLEGAVFEPAEKADYLFRAKASGFADSTPLSLALGHRYQQTTTVCDLSDEAVFSANTTDESGTDWTTFIKYTDMPAGTVYGHLKSATFSNIAVQNNNLTARYSFAKGYGLANNYGYWVKTTAATAYDFAEYEEYTNSSIGQTKTTLVHNPNDVQHTFGALKRVLLYEPVDVATIEIGATGYATYSSDKALDFTDSGIEAFYATGNSENMSFDNQIANPAASTGLLLKGDEGSYEVVVAESGTDVSSENKLVACLTEKTVGTTEGCDYGKVFILSQHDGKLGFFRSDNGRTLAAGKSYLYLEDVSTARAAIGFSLDDNATAVQSVAVPQQPSVCYDLQGRRVSANAKGIYIINSKKVIVK